MTGDGSNEGYKSCVQYVPNSNGKEIVAMGFTGISYSRDSGHTWHKLSDESFLSFRFITESIAIASGNNKLSLVYFK